MRRARAFTATATLAALSVVALPSQTAAAFAAPATGTTDEVRLHSGGFIKGEITEYMPGAYVVILPRGASEPKRVLWVDISEIVRDGKLESASAAAPPPPQGQPQPQPQWQQPQPQPQPQVQPQPQPQVQPQPQAQPQPVEPVAAELDSTQLHIDQIGGKEPVVLFHVDGEAIAVSGSYTARAVAFSEVCVSPCDGTLIDPTGEFYIAGDEYRASKRFRLPANALGYDLRVKPGSKGLAIGGYITAIMLPTSAISLIIAGVLFDMPKSASTGFLAGGSVLAIAGLGGGITMMVFSRTKVEVLPW